MDVRRRIMVRGAFGALALAGGSARFAHATTQGRADALDGAWQGMLSLPQGDTTAFALRIAPIADGRRLVRITIPAMHVYDAPIEVLTALPDGRYRFDPFGSVATRDGDRLVGEFAYLRLPFALERVAALPDARDTPPADAPAGPAPTWTRGLGAPVWGSPVTRDGVVYLGDGAGRLHALRVADGSPAWTAAIGAPLWGDAAVDGDGVLVVDERGVLTRVDRATGRLRWRVPLERATSPGAPPSADFTYTHRTPRPVVDGATVYVGGRDKSLRALALADGRERWQAALPGAAMSGVAVAGGRIYAGTFDADGVVALDRGSGRVLWTFRTAQPVSSTPAVAGDLVLAGARDFAIHGLDAANGAPRWTHSYLFSWVESTPAIVGGVAYFGSSDLRSIRAIALRTGRTLWTSDVGGQTWGTPAVDGDRLYAGVAGQTDVMVTHQPALCALDRASGALLWRRTVTGASGDRSGFIGSPCVAGRTLVAAAVDGTVYAVPLDA